MERKVVPEIMLTLLLISMLALAFKNQPTNATSSRASKIGRNDDFDAIHGMVLKWDYAKNMSSGNDIASDVAIDSQENIIVVGYDSNTTSGKFEWRIVKFDKDKRLLQNTSFDPNPNDYDMAYAVAIDSEVNIIVVGRDKEPGNYQWRVG